MYSFIYIYVIYYISKVYILINQKHQPLETRFMNKWQSLIQKMTGHIYNANIPQEI